MDFKTWNENYDEASAAFDAWLTGDSHALDIFGDMMEDAGEDREVLKQLPDIKRLRSFLEAISPANIGKTSSYMLYTESKNLGQLLLLAIWSMEGKGPLTTHAATTLDSYIRQRVVQILEAHRLLLEGIPEEGQWIHSSLSRIISVAANGKEDTLYKLFNKFADALQGYLEANEDTDILSRGQRRMLHYLWCASVAMSNFTY